jgi:YNFM family putative membrane transporter
MTGFLLGAAAMFAVTYSTQAILPELGRAFDVSPAEAGSTISVVVLALAVGAWIWGPLSDRYGRKRSIVLASTLVVAPTIGAAVAPTFALLLVCRALQGLCMPGLLTAGVPYITEVFVPRLGGRAMGSYVAALIAGGLIGRVGVALLADAVGWRWAIGLLALLPLTAAILMRRSLLDVPPAEPTTSRRWSAARTQLRNRELLKTTAAGSAFFFTPSSGPSPTSSSGWSGRRSPSGLRPEASCSRSGCSGCWGRRSAHSPTGSAGGRSHSLRLQSRRQGSR